MIVEFIFHQENKNKKDSNVHFRFSSVMWCWFQKIVLSAYNIGALARLCFTDSKLRVMSYTQAMQI
jgi:hypothetical protein